MALDPGARYPGQLNVGVPEYPYGQARNRSAPGDTDGTPWEADIVNDVLGFQQAALRHAGITPSETPDRAGDGNSQYLTALRKLRTESHLANWFSGVHASGAGAAANNRTKMIWSAVLARFVAGADTSPYVRTASRALDWETPGTPPSTSVYTFAENATRVVAGCAGGVAWYTDDGDVWVECTDGGGAIIHYDAIRDVFVGIEFDGDVDSSGDGETFAGVGAVGAMTGQSLVNARGLTCNGTRWVVVGQGDNGVGDAALIKSSDNDGETWTERSSPTDPAAGNSLYSVIWSERLELFVACGAAGRVLTSPNGADWTEQVTGVTATLLHVMEVDEVLVVAGASTLITSEDGVNWVRRVVPTGMTLLPQNTAGMTNSPIGIVGHAVNALLR